jgi:predicted molibdopterin-dependent oxidoreductase YjgC
MGALPDLLPGYQSVDDAQAKKASKDRWGIELPDRAGLTATEMFEGTREGKIKAMIISGDDPLLSFPNPNRLREALASLEFLMVIDIFPTQITDLAHVVLPAASFAEKEGTFTNFEGRGQRLRQAIQPAGNSMPEWQIILQLAERMGAPLPFKSLQQVMDEIQETVPFYHAAEFKYPLPKGAYRTEADKEPAKARRLYKGQFPSGFVRFLPVHYKPPTDTYNDGYNIMLLAGESLYHSANGILTSRSQRLTQFSPKAYVEISAFDAERIGIADGDSVRIVSESGEVTTEARVADNLSPGMAFTPVCFPSTPVNHLFGTRLDPRTKSPALMACAVRLERSDPNG